MGRVQQLEDLLENHPGIDVNWKDEQSWTALHWASQNGHDRVVKVLLAQPAINVNVRNQYESTPVVFACGTTCISVIRMLLKDPRVDITLADNCECTPLWFASRYGYSEVVECLMASGKDLGDLNKKGIWFSEQLSALDMAQREVRTDVVSLLERFIGNPAQTRHGLRMKLGVLDALAAEVFALAVFLCDDLVQLRPTLASATPIHDGPTRFFIIASTLPMELQMILCHRVVGSGKQNILRKDSEAAFKALAWILLRSPQNNSYSSLSLATRLVSQQ